uniref:Thioredoxin domain-containing protein n=1 Tax=Alexandrium catenella TaxID=2925 RepID=A0A7S1WLG7_ALECA
MNRISTIFVAIVPFVASAASADSTLFEKDTTLKVSRSPRPAVAQLNRQTFAGNVLKEEGVFAEHWMVLFCVDWYPPCQALQTPYEGLAATYSQALNNDTFLTDFVKFATVDCAVDKVLCNEEQVETYPTVSHYNYGEILGVWTGGSSARDTKIFTKWLEKDLVPFKAISLQSPPLLSRRERKEVMRLLAVLTAVVSFFLWAISRGADLWLAMRAQRSRGEAEKRARKQDAAQQHASSSTPAESSLSRRLPREWASERGSMEL